MTHLPSVQRTGRRPGEGGSRCGAGALVAVLEAVLDPESMQMQGSFLVEQGNDQEEPDTAAVLVAMLELPDSVGVFSQAGQ